MKKAIINILLLFLVFGCTGSPAQTSYMSQKNRDNMLKLNQGMTKQQVMEIMGKPYQTEAYNGVEFWLYMTEAVTIDDRRVDERVLTPFAFEKGILVGWGRNYYEQVITLRHDINVKK